jgi:hypothetical protein
MWCVALLCCMGACDDKGEAAANGADAAAGTPSEKAGEAAANGADADADADVKEKKEKKAKKDRGDASMSIGGKAWTAESAKAKLAGSKLTIRASRMDMAEGKVSRQELHLQIDDYKGAGDYETGISGSRFVGVGLDTEAAKAAGNDDAKTTKVATDALTAAKHMLLMKAKVHIETAGDAEIVGTFSWTPPPGMNDPEISEGKFRAILDEK